MKIICILLFFLFFINNSHATNDNKTCDLNTVKIFNGQMMTCRERDVTTIDGIGNNCCEDIGTNKYNGNESNREAVTESIYKSIAGGDVGDLALKLGIENLVGGPIAIFYGGVFDLMVQWGLMSDNPISVIAGKVVDTFTGGQCDTNEIMLSTLKNVYKTGDRTGTCIYLGQYCHKYEAGCDRFSIFGKKYEINRSSRCIRRANIYCCYPNIMDKAIIKAAKDQLGKTFGTYPTSANRNACNEQKNEINVDCSGITIDELSKLNLNTPSFKSDLEDFVNSKMNEIDINSHINDYKNLSKDILKSYSN